MSQSLVLIYAITYSVALLTLISLGLAVIFGMMRVINFAHGEFIMLGGYATVISANHGVNIWVAMLIVAPVSVGLIGIVAERLIIRRLYAHAISTMLATWGLSLFIIGVTTSLFGTAVLGVRAPLGHLSFGAFSISIYQIFLIVAAIGLTVGLLLVLKRTSLGLVARGTMQNPEMASTIGIDPSRVYAATFAIGAALSGLAGGLLAPVSGVIPTIGSTYIARAFVTVISGGSALVTGTVSAAALLGPIEAIVSYTMTPTIGQAALLIVAIILLRILPQGISGFWQRARA